MSQSQKVYLARKRIPIHDKPDGSRIGHFERLKYPLGALELEHRDDWHHVAVAHWQGTIWHGWIRGKYLQEPKESGGVSGGIGGLLGQGRELQAHRCTQDLPLVALVKGSEHPAGTVKAGALISVKSTDTRKGWVSVELPDAWLRATEGSELQVSSTVLECPIESWTSGKLK